MFIRYFCDTVLFTLINAVLSGMWKGLFPRIIMIGTLTALQWFIYDSVKVYFRLPRPPPPEMPESLKRKLGITQWWWLHFRMRAWTFRRSVYWTHNRYILIMLFSICQGGKNLFHVLIFKNVLLLIYFMALTDFGHDLGHLSMCAIWRGTW